MNNQTKPEQVMAWEAPTWLRGALAFQEISNPGADSDFLDGDDATLVEDHPLGFV